MNISSKIILYVGLMGLLGCTRTVSPSKTTNTSIDNYEEDIAAVRIKYAPQPEVTASEPKIIKEKSRGIIVQLPQQVNNQVNIALDSMAFRNKNIRYAAGYRVQVYVGNNRREVDEAKIYIYQNFSELNTYLTFSQPTYKLKVGDFISRLDAEHYFSSIKQRYSMAMIVSEKIDIKKSIQMK